MRRHCQRLPPAKRGARLSWIGVSGLGEEKVKSVVLVMICLGGWACQGGNSTAPLSHSGPSIYPFSHQPLGNVTLNLGRVRPGTERRETIQILAARGVQLPAKLAPHSSRLQATLKRLGDGIALNLVYRAGSKVATDKQTVALMDAEGSEVGVVTVLAAIG